MATHQKLQLEKINLEYSRFVKDQVLTEVQLNELIDFFEDQHRLTRTCLIGTGIVCGLHLAATAQRVTLSRGVAITTDGDLLKMEDTEYTHYKTYNLPEEGRYEPFVYANGSGEQTVTLLQLLTDEEAAEINGSQVHPISQLNQHVQDWVGLLFLEYYLKDPEKCTPVNCDNLGRRQVAKPRVLVLSREDMDRVVHRGDDDPGDDLYLRYHEARENYFSFPVLITRRVLLNNTNTLSSNALAGAYFKEVQDGAGALIKAITDLYRAFRFMIDPAGQTNIDQLMNSLLQNLNRSDNALHAQYTWDFYRDIVQAYNELRETLYELAFECCPNIYAFPKHIMLGAPNEQSEGMPGIFRHQFYPSPLFGKDHTLDGKAVTMMQRMVLMIQGFNPSSAGTVRITPSRNYHAPLEKRAIPVYFRNPGPLSKAWNHSLKVTGREKRNLSYHANQYTPPVPDQTLNPLNYSIDENDFFRIEGHIGREYKEVMREIDNIKTSKGVPVEVVALRLGDPRLSDLNIDDFECHFEDLYTMLRAFQTEISCLLGEGSNFFSGFTPKPSFPHISLDRFIPPDNQPPWVINPDLLRFSMNIAKTDNNIIHLKRAVSTEDISKQLEERLKAANISEMSGINIRDIIGELGNIDLSRGDMTIDICQRFLTPVFRIERIVQETLDLHPDAFGKYFLMALTEPVDSVDSFMERVRTFAAQDEELNALDENDRNVLFEYPAQIVGHLHMVQRFVPESVRVINTGFILNYRDFSRSLCRRLKIMRTRLERHFRTGNYISRGFESNYMNMIDRMERICCSNQKLEVIMREIERRKTEILSHLSLAKYAEKNPGLEHKAGTPPGGTFVIVYAGATDTPATQTPLQNALTNIRAEANESLTRATIRESLRYRDVDSFAYFIVTHDDNINREEELSNFLAFNNILPSSSFAEQMIRRLNERVTEISRIICKDITTPPRDIVVADFSLPYLCCSDCPPVAFVIGKGQEQEPDPDPDPDPVDLSIKPEEFCSNDNHLYPFTVSPPGGVVTTEDPNLAAAVVQDENGDFHFNPSLLPASHHGNPVKFTVNSQPAEVTVIVHRQPVAKILAPEIDYEPGLIYLNLEAEPNPDIEENTIYKWIFPDNTTLEGRTVNIHFKTDLFDGEIPVQLIVTHQICEAEDNISIPIEQEDPEEPPVPCLDVVMGFINERLRFLNLPSTRTAVESMGDGSLFELYQNTIQQFEASLDLMRRPNRARFLLIQINNLNTFLRQVYSFRPRTDNPSALRIVEEFIRMLFMLMLHLVRCDNTIANNIKSVIINHIVFLTRSWPNIIGFYTQLNAENILNNQINEYLDNFESQDEQLKAALEALLKRMQS